MSSHESSGSPESPEPSELYMRRAAKIAEGLTLLAGRIFEAEENDKDYNGWWYEETLPDGSRKFERETEGAGSLETLTVGQLQSNGMPDVVAYRNETEVYGEDPWFLLSAVEVHGAAEIRSLFAVVSTDYDRLPKVEPLRTDDWDSFLALGQMVIWADEQRQSQQ